MNLDSYHINADTDSKTFEFVSDGPKGKIKKVILFSKLLGMEDVYNLAFGDFNEAINRMDDLIVSNNNDAEKVIATVARAAIMFSQEYPHARIFARGSTPSRTRFYCMGISKYLKEISESFEILGALDNQQWELFKKDQTYEALLARRKIN